MRGSFYAEGGDGGGGRRGWAGEGETGGGRRVGSKYALYMEIDPFGSVKSPVGLVVLVWGTVNQGGQTDLIILDLV